MFVSGFKINTSRNLFFSIFLRESENLFDYFFSLKTRQIF